MANGEISGPPAVDFYGMLSGLGNTIQKRQQEQLAQQKEQAGLAAFSQLDPNSPNYAAAAQAAFQSGNMEAGQKLLSLKIAADEAKRVAANDQFSHGIQSANLKIAQANLANNSEGPEEVTAQRIAAAKSIGLQPGTPEHTQYIANGSIPEAANKPVPFETLGGTKFMVRQGSGWSIVDPSSLAAPVPSSPRMVGDAEGVASGLYDPPNAPGQRPPVQVADAQPSNFAARFQGQSGQAPQAPQPPQQPVDITAVDPQTGRRENWLKSQSPDVQAYIKKIADYEIDPRTTSIKGGHREQVLSAVAQYDPTYDQNNFGSRAKAIRDFATGSQGNSVRSFDVAIDHLDTLQKYATAMKSGDIRIINAIRNKWREETGSDLPTNVQAVAPIVGAEVSKAIIGSNNALADREELRKPLALASSPEQLTGAIEGYKALMGGQLKGLKKQYEDTTGKKDFDKRVREGTRKVLLGGESSNSGPVTIDGYTIKEH